MKHVRNNHIQFLFGIIVSKETQITIPAHPFKEGRNRKSKLKESPALVGLGPLLCLQWLLLWHRLASGSQQLLWTVPMQLLLWLMAARADAQLASCPRLALSLTIAGLLYNLSKGHYTTWQQRPDRHSLTLESPWLRSLFTIQRQGMAGGWRRLPLLLPLHEGQHGPMVVRGKGCSAKSASRQAGRALPHPSPPPLPPLS